MAGAASSSSSSSSFIKHDLVKSVGLGYWQDVIEKYKNYSESHEVTISKSGETAIHIAVANRSEQVVEGLVYLCAKKALEIRNHDGDTPLHVAANVGTTRMCRCIAMRHSNLIGWRNKNGETPLFLAVSQGKMSAFRCLQRISENGGDRRYAYYRRNNGDTILHAAISGGHFDIAFYIIHVYGELVHTVNEDGMSALHLLASKPSAFASGAHLYFLRKFAFRCLYVCKLRKPDDHVTSNISSTWLPSCFTNIIHHQSEGRRKNHQQNEAAANEQVDVRVENHQQDEAANEQVGIHVEIYQQDEEAVNKQAHVPSILRAPTHQWFYQYSVMCLHVLGYIFTLIMGVSKLISHISGHARYARFRNLKRRCVWSVQVMDELLEHSYTYAKEQYGMCPWENPTNDLSEFLTIDGRSVNLTISATKKTPVLLIAAKNGVVEIVEKVLDHDPDAIEDVDSDKKNIVMLAVENRHVPLYKFLLRDPTVMKTIFGLEDKDGNSVLHIAANLGDDDRPWRIRGAALQMHMEVKWYKYVKHSMPPGFFVRQNNNQETSREIFKRTHDKLKDEGKYWLISYAQSCSVVAALIATVAFATSTTIPGGVSQDKGTPLLEHKPIFIISAVASLVALCSSMMSVIMFLGILTSNMKQKDFRKDLPHKLLLGSISLLISIVSMFVSFFAGHYFIMKNELKHSATLVYALFCLPLVVYIIDKFPLDLWTIWTTFKTEPLQRKIRTK